MAIRGKPEWLKNRGEWRYLCIAAAGVGVLALVSAFTTPIVELPVLSCIVSAAVVVGMRFVFLSDWNQAGKRGRSDGLWPVTLGLLVLCVVIVIPVVFGPTFIIGASLGAVAFKIRDLNQVILSAVVVLFSLLLNFPAVGSVIPSYPTSSIFSFDMTVLILSALFFVLACASAMKYVHSLRRLQV